MGVSADNFSSELRMIGCTAHINIDLQMEKLICIMICLMPGKILHNKI